MILKSVSQITPLFTDQPDGNKTPDYQGDDGTPKTPEYDATTVRFTLVLVNLLVSQQLLVKLAVTWFLVSDNSRGTPCI